MLSHFSGKEPGATPLLAARTHRHRRTARLLPIGLVLIAGVRNHSALNVVQLYDPVTYTWSEADSMGNRAEGTAFTRAILFR
jgi:hypothetical protein